MLSGVSEVQDTISYELVLPQESNQYGMVVLDISLKVHQREFHVSATHPLTGVVCQGQTREQLSLVTSSILILPYFASRIGDA